MKVTKTAGIIIIGNEILSGKVHDVNSFYLSRELRSLGVDVRRISVIPDEIDEIGKEAVEFSSNFDFVFTSGGVGPTHDDVTMAAIAKGFGVGLVSNPSILDILCSKYEKIPNKAILKMAEIPEGSDIIFNKYMRFPIVLYRNVYIFPGIPDYLKNKFTAIRERFRSSSFFLRRLFLNTHESEIAETLNKVVAENEDVVFGSYPIIGQSDYRIMITAESRVEKSLEYAVAELIDKLPAGVLVRAE